MPDSPSETWIVLANLALAAVVALPVAFLLASGFVSLVRRRGRRTRRVQLPGIGEILVLKR